MSAPNPLLATLFSRTGLTTSGAGLSGGAGLLAGSSGTYLISQTYYYANLAAREQHVKAMHQAGIKVLCEPGIYTQIAIFGNKLVLEAVRHNKTTAAIMAIGSILLYASIKSKTENQGG